MQPFAGVRGAGTGFNLLGVTGLLVKSEWLGERSGFGADASSSHIFFSGQDRSPMGVKRGPVSGGVRGRAGQQSIARIT